MSNPIKIIECPRDAMQGIKDFIPTEKKVQYIQSLLRVGFDTIDFGSFVSPRAVPQMKDTHYVLDNLDLTNSKSKLLSIEELPIECKRVKFIFSDRFFLSLIISFEILSISRVGFP